MTFSVDADLSELKAATADAVKALVQGLEEGVKEAAHAVRNDAKRNVPVDTGTLRDGIGAQTRGLKADVAVFDKDAFYGEFIEHGTSTRPARPFMLPAAERERKRFVKRLIKSVERRL